jgi:hypothetical protein
MMASWPCRCPWVRTQLSRLGGCFDQHMLPPHPPPPPPTPPAGPCAGPLAGRRQGQARGAEQRSQALGDVAGARALPQAGWAGRPRSAAGSAAPSAHLQLSATAAGAAGKFRAIGVSNYEQHHLAELCARASVPPAVNQFEVHPRRQARALRAACAAAGVAVVAYASLGCGDLLKHPVVRQVAAAAGKTPAQVRCSGRQPQRCRCHPRLRCATTLMQRTAVEMLHLLAAHTTLAPCCRSSCAGGCSQVVRCCRSRCILSTSSNTRRARCWAGS